MAETLTKFVYQEEAMEREFCFDCTAPQDRAMTQKEIASALQRRLDLYTRERCPRMMALADRLNRVEKVSPEVSERRARWRLRFAPLDWALGTLMLAAAWTDPMEMPVVLAAGLAGMLLGVVLLWSRKRGTVTVLQLAAGAVFVFLGIAGRESMGALLSLGLVYLVIGVVAAVPRKKTRESTFEKQALPLLDAMEKAQGHRVCLIFSDTGMKLAVEEDISQECPNDQLEAAVETHSLLVLAFGGRAVTLQKKDMVSGGLDELRSELARMRYTGFQPDPE